MTPSPTLPHMPPPQLAQVRGKLVDAASSSKSTWALLSSVGNLALPSRGDQRPQRPPEPEELDLVSDFRRRELDSILAFLASRAPKNRPASPPRRLPPIFPRELRGHLAPVVEAANFVEGRVPGQGGRDAEAHDASRPPMSSSAAAEDGPESAKPPTAVLHFSDVPVSAEDVAARRGGAAVSAALAAVSRVHLAAASPAARRAFYGGDGGGVYSGGGDIRSGRISHHSLGEDQFGRSRARESSVSHKPRASRSISVSSVGSAASEVPQRHRAGAPRIWEEGGAAKMPMTSGRSRRRRDGHVALAAADLDGAVFLPSLGRYKPGLPRDVRGLVGVRGR